MKSLKIILPVGLCALLVSGLQTRGILQEAQKKLQTEKIITGTRNREILSEREALNDYKKWLQQEEKDRAFKRRFGLSD